MRAPDNPNRNCCVWHGEFIVDARLADLKAAVCPEGKGGQTTDPIVEEAVNKVLAAGKKYNVPVGYPAGNPAEINKRIAQGFRFFQGSSDLGLMTAGARDVLSKVQRDETGAPKTNPEIKK
ncbi:MAG: hypothetical protein ACREEM_22180 [Blastocatellia bacterium]